jgi:esterase/lipase superfamily enzyme
MKYFPQFILLCLSFSCTKIPLKNSSSNPGIEPTVPPVVLPTVIPSVTPANITNPVSNNVVPINLWQNIDDEILNTINPAFNKYFKDDFADTKTLDIFVATNRKAKSKGFLCSDEQFSVELDPLTQFGLCKINVPKNHSVGKIDLAKNNRQSSHEFFKFLQSKSLLQQNFLDQIKKPGRIPLVFVHGFNVKFQEAVLRAAQIAYDLKYQGPIVLFTWPAGAGDGFFDDNLLNKTYENNMKTAQGSVEAFKKFLTDLKASGLKINLAVHSMGHQVVLPALKELGLKNSDARYVHELILNAPDYQAQDFNDMTDIIQKIVNRITLYCSFNDKAMIASRSVNKNDRLGACTYSENVDSINVSLIDDDTFALGHGYYSSRAILNDVFQVLLGIEADRRLFIKKSEPNSTEKYFLRP